MSKANGDDFLLSRRSALAGGAAFGTTLWAGLSFAQGGAKFRFMTPFGYSLAFAPVLYAKAGGFFAKEGLDAEIVGGKGAALAAQMTIAGQMEAARTGAGNFMVARINNGAPLVSIATIAQVSPFFVLSPKGKELSEPASFKGKRIGMASLGGSMEETLNLTLRRAAVDPGSVEKVKVADSPASYALVEAGRIDGFMGNISTTEKARATFPGAMAVRMDDGVPGQVYVATPSQIAKSEAQYVAFLRAVHRSVTAILDAKDTEPIIREIAKSFDIGKLEDLALAKRDLAKNAESWVAKGRGNLLRHVPELWSGAVRLMTEAQMIKSAPDAATLYTNALLDKALR
jgi:ABC-type nitrate/sulfonate/bicarbonate transport system substrate-binding protein